MPITELNQFQNEIAEKLNKIYGDVKTEWRSMTGEDALYSPRLDIAVGPFATIPSVSLTSDYDKLMESKQSKYFIEKILEHHNLNVREFDEYDIGQNFKDLKELNRNSRCLMAIEIENQVSRKHLMGGAINAAALGRVGIVVPWSDEKLKAFLKLRKYLQYLFRAEKSTFQTANLLILTRDQLSEAVEDSISNWDLITFKYNK